MFLIGLRQIDSFVSKQMYTLLLGRSTHDLTQTEGGLVVFWFWHFYFRMRLLRCRVHLVGAACQARDAVLPDTLYPTQYSFVCTVYKHPRIEFENDLDQMYPVELEIKNTT